MTTNVTKEESNTKKEYSPEEQDHTKRELFINFAKLISKFSSEYTTSLKDWKEFPNESYLENPESKNKFYKKIKLNVHLLLKISVEKKHPQIERILKFTENLLFNENETLDSLVKLNLLVNNGITLLQICNKAKPPTQEEINQIMLRYLTTIIKNFTFIYQNTFAGLLSILSNNLSIVNNIPMFFDYEEFFVNEDKYINEKLVQRIKEETLKINKNNVDEGTFAKEFKLDEIDYGSDLDLLFYINVLYEYKDLMKKKETCSKEEYEEYKEKVKEKLFKDREQTKELAMKNEEQ